ncbi:MAG: hypothetical protein KC416_08690 [Myxococcales bacterium]|nr:hypothetical protein [Myxococcales bacterium]
MGRPASLGAPLGRLCRRALPFVLVTSALVLVRVSSAAAHADYPRSLQLLFDSSDPNRILVRTSFGLVLTSDGGESWQWFCYEALDFSHDDLIRPVAGILGDGDLFLAGATGLWTGTPNGCDWEKPEETLSDIYVPSAVVDSTEGSRAYVVTSSAKGPNHVARTSDSGKTWSQAGESFGQALLEEIAVAPSDSNRVYVVSRTFDLEGTDPPTVTFHRSEDGGDTWEGESLGFTQVDRTLSILGVHPKDPDLVIVAERDSITHVIKKAQRTEDGGKTWTNLPALVDIQTEAATYSQDGESFWVGGISDSGLHLSTDDGDSFKVVHPTIEVACLHHDGKELWICTDVFTDGYVIGRSSDGGKTVEPVMTFQDIDGLISCGADSVVERACGTMLVPINLGGGGDASLPGIEPLDAGTGPMEPKPASSLCAVTRAPGGRGGHSYVGLGVLLVVSLLWRGRYLSTISRSQ